MKLTYKTLITLPLRDNPPGQPMLVNDMIKIYPNPVTTTLNIHGMKELHKPLLAQVCDIYGRVMIEEKSYRNDFIINVSSLHTGAYLLKLYNGYDRELQVERIIKK